MAGSRVAGAVRRWVLTRIGAEPDDGFVLLESMIAIGIITVVMSAVGAVFVSGLASTSQQRAHQGAVQIADSTIEQIRSLHPSDLVTGRDPASVDDQFRNASALVRPWLAAMEQVSDSSAGTAAGSTAAVPTKSTTTRLGSRSYTVTQYLGQCSVPASAGSSRSQDDDNCVKPSDVGSTGTPYLRAVVAVTWTGDSCTVTACGYVTSTLVDQAADRTFRINAAPYASPAIVVPGPQTSVVQDAVTLQLRVQEGTGVPNFRWSLADGTNLPDGLSLSPTGLITGTATTVGSSTATVQVTDAFDRSDTYALKWTVAPTITLADPGPQAAVLGRPTSATLTATGGLGKPYTYSVVGDSLPPGLSLSPATGIIAGSPTSAGTYTVTVGVVDSRNHAATVRFTWTVDDSPMVASDPGKQVATVSQPIAPLRLTAGGGSGTYVWSDPSGSLPAGLSLSRDGVVSGTPTTLTSDTLVTLTVQDAALATRTATVSFHWAVVGPPTVAAPGGSFTVSVGQPVAFDLSTTCPNAPCTYRLVNGPDGLSIDASGHVTGSIGGLAATYDSVSVVVTDAAGATSRTDPFTVVVKAAPTVAVANQTSTVDQPVNVGVKTSCGNGPCTYRLNDGPAGLRIDGSGQFSGSVNAVGSFSSVTVTVTDAGGVSVTSAPFTWNVVSGPSVSAPAPYFTLTVGMRVDFDLTTTCPNAPCTYSVDNISDASLGLTITSTGHVSGTVGGPATTYANVTITVKDAAGATATTSPFTVDVRNPPSITGSPQTSTVGQAVTLPLNPTCPNGPCRYTVSGAPTGLSIDSTSGVLSGTVTADPGTYSFTVSATDAAGVHVTSGPSIWTVVAGPTVSVADQTSTLGQVIELATAASCPNTPCTYALAGAPSGLTVKGAGVITGTIVGSAQTYANVTLSVTDAAGVRATSTPFTWTVLARPSVTSPGTVTNTLDRPITRTLTSSCPNGPCTYRLDNGPTGVRVTASDGTSVTIGGTPTGGAQSYQGVTVTATDAAGIRSTSDAFTWNIVAGPVVTSPGNLTETVGQVVTQTLFTSCPNTPCTYRLDNGPAWLSVNSSGVLVGTVTGSPQTYSGLTVTVTDPDGATSTSSAFSIVVKAAPTVTSPGTLTDTLAQPITRTVTSTCPNTPCTYTLTNAPPGLSVTGATAGGVTIAGTITGNPTSYPGVTVTVTDAAGVGTTSDAFTWNVVARPTVGAPGSTLTATVGQSVAFQLPTSCPNRPCTYVLNNGPGGLSISSTGYVTGSVAGPAKTYAGVTVTVTDADGATGSTAPFTVVVQNGPTVTGPSRTDTVGQPVNASLTTTCPNGPCTYTLNNAPAGLTVSGSGAITGSITSSPGNYTVTATVTDAGGVSSTSPPFTWNVLARPMVTAPGTLTVTVGQLVTRTVMASCPNTPCTYALANAPSWLTINASGVLTGTVSGTPQTYSGLTVTLTDADGATATSSAFSIVVKAAPTVTVPNQTSTLGQTVNLNAANTTTCDNAPCTYALSGAPTGLAISSSTGVISGTIGGTVATYNNVVVTVTDAAGISVASSPFRWTVLAAPSVTSPGNLTDTLGRPITRALTTSCPNSPCTYTLNNGPAGLSVNASGVISGTITGTATSYPGVSVTVRDAGGISSTSASFTWNVVAAPTVTAPGTLTVTVGQLITRTVIASCPNTPCTYALANAPSWLTINASGVLTGTVSGTPQTYSGLTVTLTDADGATATSSAFSIVVKAAPTATVPNQTSTLGQTVSVTPATTCPNSPCTYAVTGAPTGLAISSSTGVISGTIGGSAATYTNVVVTVTDAAGISVASSPSTWTVLAKATVTSPGTLTDTLGRPITRTLTSSCPNSPCSYVLNNGPTGLSVTGSTTRSVTIGGTIGGTATSYQGVTVTVTDAAGVSTTSTAFTWNVVAGPTVTAPGTQTATVGQSVAVQLSTSCLNSPCAYTLNNGPAGLSVNASGVLTGTVGGSATIYTNVTVTVIDADGATSTSAVFSFAVVNGPTVSGAARSDTTGRPVSVQLTTTCPNGPCSYTLAGAPAGLSINSSGLITGTITSNPGSFSVTATVTDAGGISSTSPAFTWTVLARPVVTAPSTLTETVGQVVSQTLIASCPNTPCTYVLNNGPTGLSVNASGVLTGTVGGTPQTYGTVTVTVTDASGATASSAAFTIVVRAAPTVTVPNQTSTLGQTVSVTPTTSCPNTPCSYALTGAPTGLTISSSTGVISGTIGGSPGTATPTISVTDAAGVSVGSSFSWTVLAAPAVTAPGTLTNTIGRPITRTLTTSCPNGPCTYTLTNGPTGLTVVGSTATSVTIAGTITGTAKSYAGVTVTAKDAGGISSTSSSFTWNVVNAPTVVSPGNLTQTVGQVISQPLSTSCPNAPCTYALNNGPAGLTVSQSGVITGTVGGSAATYSNVTVSVADADGATGATPVFVIVVKAGPTVSGSPQTDTLGQPVNLQLTTSCPNSPCSYTLAGAPAGLSVNSSGLITGTITSNPDTYSTTVTVRDNAGVTVTSSAFAWTVAARPTVNAPGSSFTVSVGQSVSVQLSTSCPNSPCSYAINNGPSGLGINASGLVSGRIGGPAQTYTTTVTVTDADGATATTAAFTIEVKAAPTVSLGNQASTVGQTVSVTPTISCPNAPCTYALTGAPTGLAINASTGVISGTIGGSPGQAQPTITITDASGVSATSPAFTWTVFAPPSVSGLSATPIGETSTPSVPITYSCPAGSCTVALSGTLASSSVGIGLSTTAVSTTANTVRSLTVSGTSGTVYLTGLVSTSAVTTGTTAAYGVSLDVTDSNGVKPATSSATWTAYSTPTIATPGNLTTSQNATPSQPLPFRCPTSQCTVTVTGAPSGIGLSGSTTNNQTNTTLSGTVTGPSTTRSTNLNGRVSGTATKGTYLVTITITSGSTTISSSGIWTVQ